MKKTITLLAAAALVLALLAGCDRQEGAVKIGVVDEAAAFKDNKVAKDAMAYLQEMGAPLQAEAEAAYKAMQENQTEETVAAYKLAMGKLQNVMNGEQQRIVALVDAKFNEVLEKYRAEKGLTMILSRQAVISASDAVDVTADIVAAMDGVNLDFNPPAEMAKPESKAETEQPKAESEPEKAEAEQPEAESGQPKAETEQPKAETEQPEAGSESAE
ncbi:MAG: OmpH family outer membrane protein [Desulfovibrionaceae bacterium]|nr:OmpH family outer membrane protein [Desulfovibrionaceae bacterium]